MWLVHAKCNADIHHILPTGHQMPPDYQEIVREFVSASRKVIELGDLTDEEEDVIKNATERLLAVIANVHEE
jgi:hypothetical protein